jgi:hypothetical protein
VGTNGYRFCIWQQQGYTHPEFQIPENPAGEFLNTYSTWDLLSDKLFEAPSLIFMQTSDIFEEVGNVGCVLPAKSFQPTGNLFRIPSRIPLKNSILMKF